MTLRATAMNDFETAREPGVKNRPIYIASGEEETVFRIAHAQRLAIMLKGPTGVGKTRLVETMAHDLGRPLITVACHEDLTASDLVGRYVLKGGETVWEDGPLTTAVKTGAICYLDEIVEARADTIVVLHSLLDHRRELFVDRQGMSLVAEAGFMLVLSYNPGYQSVLKDLKESTRQRLVAIELDFPRADVEREVLIQEAGASAELADDLVRFATAVRALNAPGMRETASTRVLIATARLVQGGLSLRAAAHAAIALPLSDDPAITRGLTQLIDTHF